MANNLQVYIKEYNDAVWTDITDRVVKTDFKLRSGFSTLGGSINLSKLDITYRASDLAVAAIFHTTAKQIRIKKNGTAIWEGYTEGGASVTSTATTSLAWVKISAYPYIHAFEDIQAENDEVYYNIFMCNPEQESVSLLHLLWNKMVDGCTSPFGDAIESTLTVNLPTISAQRSIAIIEEGEKYLSIFLEILKQYGYVVVVDGLEINFLQPYSDDYRQISVIPYTKIQTNPTIKTAPYEVTTQPIVTLTRITTKDDCRVYSLAESDDENAEEELYIGASHPSEGDYEEVSYSNEDIESDTCKLIYAKNPTMTYKARYSDDSADAVLQVDKLELGATSAKIKLTNTNTELSCYLNQLWITAEKAYFEDTSIKVASSIKKGTITEETTEWLSYEAHATAYINALIAEQKASTSSLKFKSNLLGNTFKPNDLIKIGSINAVYIIKQIDENIVTGEKEYTCGIFSLSSGTGTEYKKKGETSKRGPRGEQGAQGEQGEAGTAPVTCDISPSSYTLVADEDGLVSATYYQSIRIIITVKQLYEGVYTNLLVSETATEKGTYQVGVVCAGITNWTITGNEFRCSADSVMLKDSEEVKFTITYKDFFGNTGVYTKYANIVRARSGKTTPLLFAWSLSETEFIPRVPKFFVQSGTIFNLNSKLLGRFPIKKEWLTNADDIYSYRDEEYRYLWCKVGYDNTPFLFTGSTGDTGMSGAYVLYQYALGDSQGNQPSANAWSDTMPSNLIGSGGFLWVRTKSVPAGGAPETVNWGTPVIAGSDNVEVYQRITDTEADIATITQTAGALEQRVTALDKEDGVISRMQSTITQTADKIALKVDGTNIKDSAGIVVGSLDGSGHISLTASKILLNGSVTANLIDVANLLATDAFIKKLKAQNLIISIAGGMAVEIRLYDDNGSLLSPPLFKVSYNGETVFQIDASTGNVFIGKPNSGLTAPEAGFMYRKSSSSIVSKDEKVAIASSGALSIIDGFFKGEFNCSAIKTYTQSGVSDVTVNASTISDRQAQGIYDTFSSAGLSSYETLYYCTMPNFPSVRYVKFHNINSRAMLHSGNYATYIIDGVEILFYDKSLSAVDVSSYVTGNRTDSHGALGSMTVCGESNAIASWARKTWTYSGGTVINGYNGLYFSSAQQIIIPMGAQRLILDLPTSSVGLPSGAVYNDSGTLKIVTS